MIDLQAIEKREKAATKGPWWKWLPDEHGRFAVCGKRGLLERTVIAWFERWVEGRDSKDADFVAHARTDIPVLIAEVKRLEETNECWRKRMCIVVEERDLVTKINDRLRTQLKRFSEANWKEILERVEELLKEVHDAV